MPKSSFVLARLAAAALASMFFITTARAANYPLNAPQGLAVAPNGNLYVANTNSNNVLVYNPAHTQLSGKTITKGIASPTGVAFDTSGDLWVTNAASNSITEYNAAGTQIVGSTITNGISSPYGLAIDGLGDLWVNNGYVNVSVYLATASSPAFSYAWDQIATGLAMWQEYGVVGGNSYSLEFNIAQFFLNSVFENPYEFPGTGVCFAAAFDNTGNLYCGNQDDTLTTFPAGKVSSGAKTLVANLGFFPGALAVDSTRHLVYVANAIGNRIEVYTTTGTHLTTIE